jgi:hypothetical protein
MERVDIYSSKVLVLQRALNKRPLDIKEQK